MAAFDARWEFELYQDEEKLRPVGPPVRRASGLSVTLPVRLSPELLAALRRRARDAGRSAGWVTRKAIDRYLSKG